MSDMMLVAVYFSFFIIVTVLNEDSCLKNVTNKLQGQRLVSVLNTPLHCKEYTTLDLYVAGAKFRLSKSTYKTDFTCTGIYTQQVHKISS